MIPGFAAPPITIRAMNLREINYERARVGRRPLTEAEFAAVDLQASLTWMPAQPAAPVEPEQAPPVAAPGPVSWERIQGLMAATAAAKAARNETTQDTIVTEPKSVKNDAESEQTHLSGLFKK